ncbi:hypothetical protein [Salinispora tropica]|uniref:Uncharacterized protein n=1 Tax=Salinispora tropica (strain ATCC BAA-916 / DSM 44818 / JCM 13857 / NBRC 105044 / CNB-440) TaxID=369723 RepID=A4XDB9_SALTO|nr:hypothetical protein [Salinispora tropica]ABP56926.1 hypothetical protein Strop_4498 [Salinispora tropica CNB-440]
MPDPLFAELYGNTENLNWDPAGQVRERGRRRTRRTRLVAGLASVAAVAVIATSAVALAGVPDSAPPVPPATNSPSPSPTVNPTPSVPPTPSQPPQTTGQSTPNPLSPDIPAAAMLRATDLPSGFGAEGDNLDGDWSYHAGISYHCAEGGQVWPGEKAYRGAVFRKEREQAVIERVMRQTEETAAATVETVRQEVTGCVPRSAETLGMEIIDSGLAGDESLLIGLTEQHLTARWLFVRVGELVAQVWLSGVDPAEDQRIAERTAARLCAGTDAC